MNLLRDSSDLQVKKAVNILLGVVIKEKMNVSYLLWNRNPEDDLQTKKLFLFKWSVLLHYVMKYKVRLKVSLFPRWEAVFYLENFIGKAALIWIWRKEACD